MAEGRDASSPGADTWLTPEQVGRELNVHPATVRLWIRAGRLGATRVGRSWRVHRSEIDRLLTSGASPAYVEPDVDGPGPAEASAVPSPAPRQIADRLLTVTALPDPGS